MALVGIISHMKNLKRQFTSGKNVKLSQREVLVVFQNYFQFHTSHINQMQVLQII